MQRASVFCFFCLSFSVQEKIHWQNSAKEFGYSRENIFRNSCAVCVCVCVRAHMCVCKRPPYLFLHMEWLEVKAGCISLSHLCFWDGVSHWTHSSAFSDRHTCQWSCRSCIPRPTEVAGVHICAWFLHGFWDPHSGLHAYLEGTFLTWPYPQP